MAANWMAHTGITCLIVEKKLRPTNAGRADGLESRTIEIMDSFGLEHKIWGESNRTIDICLWVRNNFYSFFSLSSALSLNLHLGRSNVPMAPCNVIAFRPTPSLDGPDTRSPRWANLGLKIS